MNIGKDDPEVELRNQEFQRILEEALKKAESQGFTQLILKKPTGEEKIIDLDSKNET